MVYFNGFSLKQEEELFSEEIVDTEQSVVGFSYGAQKALEYALHSQKRIDRLILLSPAFFQNHKKSFIQRQLRAFKQDEEAYKKTFLENVAYPSTISLEAFVTHGSYEELEALLSYVWAEEKLQKLIDRGVKIEVFMGGADKIVNAQKSFEFFSKLVPVYLFKESGHLLK